MSSLFGGDLGPIPLLDPLSYPGQILARTALLDEGRLVGAGGVGEFEEMLASRGVAGLDARTRVLAVGSNGAPAQVRYKFGRAGVSCVVPMVPVRVEGVRVGVSAHVSRAGYVAAAPVVEEGAVDALVVSWLDAAQLAVMDASEGFNYRRVAAPGGEGQLYVSTRGLLLRDGVPRSGQPQRALIRELLRGSRALREVFGETPESWVRVAASDKGAREQAARMFAEEGWVRESGPHGSQG